MEIPTPDFRRCLDSVMPQVGNYDLIWKLLRIRARRRHSLPYRIYSFVKRLRPHKPYFIAKTSTGLSFLGDCRDTYAFTCALYPDWDGPNIRHLIACQQERGGAYLDVGTNLGIVATSVAKALEGQEEVFAFEPDPDTACRAAATFALNGLTNIRLFQAAVGDEDGELTFYTAPGNSEWGSVYPTNNDIPWIETRVPCLTLDRLASEGVIRRAGVIKFDVEGHELHAMCGAKTLLWRDQPTVSYEYHYSVAHTIGWTLEDVTRLLQETGEYACEVLHYDGSLTSFPPPADKHEVVNIICKSRSAPRQPEGSDRSRPHDDRERLVQPDLERKPVT